MCSYEGQPFPSHHANSLTMTINYDLFYVTDVLKYSVFYCTNAIRSVDIECPVVMF